MVHCLSSTQSLSPIFLSRHLAQCLSKSKDAIIWPYKPHLCPFLSPEEDMMYKQLTDNKTDKNLQHIIKLRKVSLKIQTFLLPRAKQKEEERAAYPQVRYTATWRVNRTLPVLARAQLRMFFLTFGETGRAPDKCICPLGKMY